MPHTPAQAHRSRCRSPARACVSLGAWVGMGLLLPSTLFAAEAARRRFDIPTGDARVTLKHFAAQASEQLLYSPDDVGGTQTHAVHGEFTPLGALDHMLERTLLKARQDGKTKAIAITSSMPSRAPPPPPLPATPPDPPKSSQSSQSKPLDSNAPTVKTRNLLTLFAGWLLATGASDAQTASTSAPIKDEAIVLSPFVVNTEKDTGYQATSTLAGTRLNTPIKDIGASISIYTKDFLDDIGATDSAGLLVFATGMEAAGPGGNFSGGSNDIGAREVIGEAARANPQGSSRARGLEAPNFTRDFFLTNIALDSYNTETVTAIRGPNATLFGVGSPAGAVDTALLRPNLNRNKSKVEVRYGNNDSLRMSVDFNRVLIDKKLAFRLAALDDKEEFNQRPAFEKKKRIYGALAFEPFKSTSLRTHFESGNTRANRPLSVLPYKSISNQWYAAGRPAFDWTFYDDPVRNPNAAAQNSANFEGAFMGPGQVLDQVVTVFSNPTDRTAAFGFLGVPRSTAGNAPDAIRNQVFNPLVNRDLAADNIRFIGTTNISELPNSFWTGANVLPGQLAGLGPAGIKAQGFTDFSAFDFKNRMIDESSRQGESFHAFNIALEQRAWDDRLGIEFAYDTQRVDRRAKNAFFSTSVASQIRVDTNVTLPTGQPNPNLGRPFAVFGQSPWPNNLSERETKRATGYLKYDFKDLPTALGKWLGRHTLTSLYEETAATLINYQTKISADGEAARLNNPNIDAANRRPRVIVYLGPSIIGNNNPLQLQPIQVPEFTTGETVPVRYFARSADATDPGAFKDAPTTFVEAFGTGMAQREVIKSQALVLHSYWFSDLLVTTLGWRRDEDYFVSKVLAFQPNPADPNDLGKVHYGFNDFSFPNTPPLNVAEEIKSYSAVMRWPKKLIQLPVGTDLSAFYNRSENFTPDAGRVDFYNKSLGSPKGETREYGFNFSAFDNKLSLRVNRFETKVVGASYKPQAFNNAVTAVLTRSGTWAEEGNINPHLVAQASADVELLFSVLPANFREIHQWKVTGTAPNLSSSRVALPGIGDRTDLTAKGTELEFVYNPTPNWRIMANVAKQETVRNNSLPVLKEFIDRMSPVWNRLKNRPTNNYPLGWKPGDPLPANVQTYGEYLDVNVFVPYANEIAAEGVAVPEQRKWRANLVTRYSFGRGSIFGEKLKGWSVGGAVRWQDKVGIGYPTTRNPDTSASIDIAHPYYAPQETNVDAFASYERKLWGGRINWKVQINVRNLYSDDAPVAVNVQPWGEVATVRLAPERRWYLTNSFAF